MQVLTSFKTAERAALATLIGQFCAKELRVASKDVELSIIEVSDLATKSGAMGKTVQMSDTEIAILMQARLRQDDFVSTLCHEMVHAKQFIKRQLTTRKTPKIIQILWNGTLLPINTPFHKRPWEREALQKELLLTYAFKEHLQSIQ